MFKSPCKDCNDRKPACHDNCKLYQAEKQRHWEEMKYIRHMNRYASTGKGPANYCKFDKSQGRFVQK